jgi:hypothetical protein
MPTLYFYLLTLGDVRMLLSLACNCLNHTVEKCLKKLLEGPGAASFATAAKNPMERIDGECVVWCGVVWCVVVWCSLAWCSVV